MSTRWGYYSKTKDESSDYWFNHGDKMLSELYEAREALFKITSLSVCITVNIGGHGSEPLDWLYEHRDEEIWLENEYMERKPIILSKSSDLTGNGESRI